MKKIIVLVFTIACALQLVAQPKTGKFQEKMQAQRAAFITQRLSLTPEEAQQFWPIFNQYTEKLRQIRSTSKPDKQLVDMSDGDAEKEILNDFDRQSKELDLKKEYYQKLKKVISVKKITRLYSAERDFKAELVERLKENREERKQIKRSKGN